MTASLPHCRFVARFLALVLLAGLGAAVAAGAPAVSGTKTGLLRAALSKADRLTISPSATDGTTPAIRELAGADAVGEFLDQAEIDENYGDIRSAAPVDAVYTFFSGDKAVATLRLRRLGYLSWEGGSWNGDAVLTPAGSQKLLVWSRAAGAEVSAVIQRLAAATVQKDNQARQRFLALFTPKARAVFAGADSIVFESSQLRRVATDLAGLYTDKNALVDAAFRALAEAPLRWMEDDWATGAVENVLLETDVSVVRAAMNRLQAEDDVMLGVARFYFRCDYQARLDAADRDSWTEKLADLALRKGKDSDKHAVLEFLSAIPGDRAAAFLEAVAQGKRVYTYAPAFDEVGLNTEEPGLPQASAVLLAMRGDPKASAIARALRRASAFGPDRAALDIADALVSPEIPLKAPVFSYRSRILGITGLDVLRHRPGSAIAVDAISAAMQHADPDVSTQAGKLAQMFRIRRSDEPPDPGLVGMNFDSLLAESYPRLAVEQYSALIPKARGQTLARLQALRAEAYSNLGDYASAEIDFLNIRKTPYADETDALARLAWVQWYQGEFAVAEQTVDDALHSNPTSELTLLRGIMRYSQDDFGLPAEADIVATTVLDPTDGYAVLFQHLVVSLGGRPGQSQLKASLKADGIPDWPRQIIAFMTGSIASDRLLELAAAGAPADVAWHKCEANFYISQSARLAGNTDDERKYLAECIALNQPHVAEFWVAKFRLAELRPGSQGPSRGARPSSI